MLNTIKVVCFSSLLATGMVNAGNQCDEFEIKVKNNLQIDLKINKFNFIGGDLQPSNIKKLEKQSEEIFVVKNSKKNMYAEFVFEANNNAKFVTLRFNLTNALFRCDHDDEGSSADGISLKNDRSLGKVTYTIG